MKFIDIYNKNKNLPIFKEKVKIFKAYCYLAKRNPKKYMVNWDKNNRCFYYLQKDYTSFGDGKVYFGWVIKKDSNDKWKEMGYFKERNY